VTEGGVTFTGSIVAFFKLAGKMSSKPLMLPARHLINGSLLGVNLAAMGGFLAAAPAVPAVAAGYLGLNTLLSFIKGYTLTAAVGGADMRMLFCIPHQNIV
jgi:H+-translocating NAD(P) transhydrogenase